MTDKAVEKEIEKLKKDWRIQKRTVKKIADIAGQWFVTLPSLQEAVSIGAMIDELVEAKTEMLEANSDIIHLCSDLTDSSKAEKLEEERFKEADTVMQMFWETKGKLLDIQQRLSVADQSVSRSSIASTSPSSNGAPCNPMVRVKLPDIPIPKFNGNPRTFFDFRNLFGSVIHNDQSLTPIQKFYFFRGALEGEAESFLKGVDLVGDQYEKTWKDFCKEYGKKRLIVAAHLADLFNLTPIKHESGIRELMSTVDVAIRGLKQCGEQTDTWSVLLSYLLSSKLDNKTRYDFENSLISNDTYPPYKKLCEFLSIRAANSTRRDFDKQPSTANQKFNNKKSSNFISTVSKCIICQAEHLLINCPEFSKMAPAKRYEAVCNAKRCTNCFNKNHYANDYRRSGCSTCGAKHHQLLHTDKAESPLNKPGSTDQAKTSFTITNPSPSFTFNCLTDETVILPTAVVKLQCGDFVGAARILLDPCSQPSALISREFVDENKLIRSLSSSSTTVKGVGGLVNTTHECRFEIVSRFGNFSLSVKADIVPESVFSYSINNLRIGAVVQKLKLLTLADPAFLKPVVNIPVVNIIIGAEHYMKIIGSKPKIKVVDGVELFSTNFGWVIIGKASSSDELSPKFIRGE